jgi:hypothetical protein
MVVKKKKERKLKVDKLSDKLYYLTDYPELTVNSAGIYVYTTAICENSPAGILLKLGKSTSILTRFYSHHTDLPFGMLSIGIIVSEEISGDIDHNLELALFKWMLDKGARRIDYENMNNIGRIREPEYMWVSGNSRKDAWQKAQKMIVDFWEKHKNNKKLITSPTMISRQNNEVIDSLLEYDYPTAKHILFHQCPPDIRPHTNQDKTDISKLVLK